MAATTAACDGITLHLTVCAVVWTYIAGTLLAATVTAINK